jgi:hypothetical protein
MTVQVKFLSAFIRRTDVDAHYPGGCAAFEAQHTCAQGDPQLLTLLAMSGQDLDYALERVAQQGLDTERLVAVADMWAGPLKQAEGIRFYSQPGSGDLPLPTWYATQEEGCHV